MTATPALRLCAPFEDVPAGQHSCPAGCRVEQCALCLRDVHYDPAASIPALGPEVIICTPCLEQPLPPAAQRLVGDWPELWDHN